MNRSRLLPLAALLLLSSAPLPAAPSDAGGVAVDRVEPGSRGEKAGFCPGDRIVGWSRSEGVGPSSGTVASTWEWERVSKEQFPRGVTLVEVERGRERLALSVEGSARGVAVRPAEPAAAGEILAAIRAAEGDDELRLAARRALEATPAGPVRGWLLVQVARNSEDDGQREEFLARALATLPAGGIEEASTRTVVAQVRMIRSDVAGADSELRAVRALEERMAPDSLSLADAVENLGTLAATFGDLDGAEEPFATSLALRARLAPGTLDHAGSLHNMGMLRDERGELDEAAAYLRQAQEVYERMAPSGRAMASVANDLGINSRKRGQLAEADRWFRRALAIQEGSGWDADVAMCFTNLGNVAENRGDLAAAEAWQRKAIAKLEADENPNLQLAHAYNNLGLVLEGRGDLDGAEEWLGRGLALRAKLAPGSLHVAESYGNLSSVARGRGDRDRQEDYALRALAIFEAEAPDSLEVAEMLTNLARLALEEGELGAAADRLERARAIADRRAPEGLAAASVRTLAGELRGIEGDFEGAEVLFRSGLALSARLAPGSAGRAGDLWAFGRMLRRAGRGGEALDLLLEAVDELERQQDRLGGAADDLATFRTRFLPLYGEILDLLVDLDLPRCAVEVVESSRARALLALLAERDLDDADLPPELAVDRRALAAEARRATARLAAAATEEERVAAEGALDDLRRRQGALAVRIRSEAPRFAALRAPRPLDAAAVQTMLEPGTLLLAWTLGDRGGTVLAVDRAGVALARVPATRRSIASRVALVRRQLVARTDPGGELASLSRDLLPASLAGRLRAAKRVVLLPDGPLWLLPPSLLGDPSSPRGGTLLDARPLSVASSATALAELRRRPAPKGRVVAFGDPVFAAEGLASVRGGASLVPLPGTRDEVARLARRRPGAEVLLGADATERAAKGIGRRGAASVVHFATHGLVDEARPLDGGIVLTADPVGGEDDALREDGFLQAWEILESVRLDAGLVVLSACDSALGREQEGEGMLGLTRAFQYAGARAVLASLWPVADASTTRLMATFYDGLARGLRRDEALRAAQLALARAKGGGTAHPFFWAPFALYGDGR